MSEMSKSFLFYSILFYASANANADVESPLSALLH